MFRQSGKRSANQRTSPPLLVNSAPTRGSEKANSEEHRRQDRTVSTERVNREVRVFLAVPLVNITSTRYLKMILATQGGRWRFGGGRHPLALAVWTSCPTELLDRSAKDVGYQWPANVPIHRGARYAGADAHDDAECPGSRCPCYPERGSHSAPERRSASSYDSSLGSQMSNSNHG